MLGGMLHWAVHKLKSVMLNVTVVWCACSCVCTQVSLAIRLAVGITEAQAAAGTDQLLANWLAQPTNIRNAIAISGVHDPIGPDAIIKWLLTPEIWVAPVSCWAGGEAAGQAVLLSQPCGEGLVVW